MSSPLLHRPGAVALDEGGTVAAVDEPRPLGQQPLLAQRVAVVPGDGAGLDGDGARPGQQGGCTHGLSPRSHGLGTTGTSRTGRRARCPS